MMFMQRYRSLISCVTFVGAIAIVACGDDDTSTGSSTTAGGAGTNASETNGSTQTNGASTNGTGTRTSGSNGTNGSNTGTSTSGTTTGISGTSTSGTNSASSTPGAGGAGGGSAAQLSDPEIASVSMTANMGEVQENQIAVTMAQRAEARDFAQDMVDMHNAALQREMSLGMSLMLTPADNAISQMLRSNAQMMVDTLQSTSADQFDAVYLQGQLDAHQMVLSLIDDTLLPSVQNDQLMNELTMMRSTVSMHLDRVRELVSGSGGAGGDESGSGGR
jgi:putative membrane protein